MNAMLFRQVESIFKHGRPLSPVTNVNVEAQANNKQGSSIGLVGRSPRRCCITSLVDVFSKRDVVLVSP
jgi:hypothetical protein